MRASRFAKSSAFNRAFHRRGSSFGGAALEYIMVSGFGLLVTVASLGFLGAYAKDRLQKISDRLEFQMEDHEELDFEF